MLSGMGERMEFMVSEWGKRGRVNVDREGSLWGVNSKEGVRGESWELGETGDLDRERLSGVRSEWEREGSECAISGETKGSE